MFGFLKRLLRRRRRMFDVASLSARGLVRPDNQDSLFISRDHTFFCVADGMCGGEGGAKASEIVCARLSRAVAHDEDFPDRVKRVAAAIREANDEIRTYAQRMDYRQMATTVSLLVVNEASSSALIGYVGDSRIYRVRQGVVKQLTHDHTLAGELSRRGSMRGLVSDLSRADKLAHVLTRAVGIEAEIEPDWRRIELQTGDWYLICSDGLYDMVDEAGLAAAFAAGGPASEVTARLEERTLQAGAQDNYTLIVFNVGEEK